MRIPIYYLHRGYYYSKKRKRFTIKPVTQILQLLQVIPNLRNSHSFGKTSSHTLTPPRPCQMCKGDTHTLLSASDLTLITFYMQNVVVQIKSHTHICWKLDASLKSAEAANLPISIVVNWLITWRKQWLIFGLYMRVK